MPTLTEQLGTLTQSVDTLTAAVNVKKVVLDTSAAAAANSATQAANSANTAATSATAASNSAAAVTNSIAESANSATQAAASAVAAVNSATQAATSANTAATSATTVATALTAANTSATAAASSATQAATSATDAATSAAASANSAIQAAASAVASANSATEAATSATAASNSAAAVTNSIAESANSATQAAASAVASANSAIEAAASATASANSATQAGTYITDLETVAASATVSIQQSIGRAEEWAENPVDQTVTTNPDKFSAKHWANKAQDIIQPVLDAFGNINIVRPTAKVPTTATEQTQLVLTDFISPVAHTQTGILFEISTSNTEFVNPVQRLVTSTSADRYQVLYPEDGFEPGEVIYWRAKYLGTESQESAFSEVYAQTFPDLITTPVPVTRENQIVGEVQATAFDSPAVFGLSYYETQTEFYSANGLTLITTVTSITNGTTAVPAVGVMPEGVSYTFRMRHGGRVTVGSPVLYSSWSPQRAFFNGAGAMLLEYNLDAALSRTVNLPIGVYDATGLNVTVNWGDGTSNTYTTGGVKSKVYAAGVGPIVNVTISGTMRQYGGNTNQQGLKRVDNWGFKLGLTSLREAVRGATAVLEYVAPSIPTTVTNLTGLFQSAILTNPALSLNGLLTDNITNMSSMFSGANFNNDVSSWNTSNVTDMSSMFGSSSFNHPSINSWNVSKVTNMSGMFNGAYFFNQPLNNWNTGSVTNMASMFAANAGNTYTASRTGIFNQNIGMWDVSKVTNMSAMFSSNGLGGAQTIFNNGGSPQIGTWNTAAVTTMANMFSQQVAGGAFNQPIGNWNTSNVTNMSYMFFACHSFNQPIGTWNTSKVTTMSNMFVCLQGSNHQFNQSVNAWDVSNVTDFSSMFAGSNINTGLFNQPLNNWNTANAVNMGSMFYVTNNFNQPISNFNLSKVTNIAGMFTYASAFNQPIGNWNVAAVTNMASLLLGSNSFNQDISGWVLNANVVLAGNGFGGGALSNLLYSKMLTGWANGINDRDFPRTRTMPLSGRTYSNIDFSADFPGKRFTNAVAARAFMVGARSVSVSGASDTTANGTYLYNSTNLTYVNSTSTWYFIRVGNRWELRNGSNAVQDTSNSLNRDEPYKETWQGMLSGATILLAGAAWTITGDTLV